MQSPTARRSPRQAFNGMVLLSVQGATAKDRFTLNAYSANGTLVGSHQFNGTGTAVYLPATHGVLLLKVTGRGVNETVKAVMR